MTYTKGELDARSIEDRGDAESIESLWAHVQEQAAVLDAQAQEIAAMRSAVSNGKKFGGNTSVSDQSPKSPERLGVSRANLLRGAAMGAAGFAAAGIASAMDAAPTAFASGESDATTFVAKGNGGTSTTPFGTGFQTALDLGNASNPDIAYYIYGVQAYGKIGVMGKSLATAGTGIQGFGSLGVLGVSNNTSGQGVVGVSSSGSITPSSIPAGVFGDGGSTTFGMYGVSSSSDGIQGHTTSATSSGTAGFNTASTGFGAYGSGEVGVWGSAHLSAGVIGTSAGAGIPAFGSPFGVWGDGGSGVGVYGQSGADDGVQGHSFSDSFSGIGGFGTIGGKGVFGTGGTGVWGQTATNGAGVVGVSSNGGSPTITETAGVWGEGGTGTGVYGKSTTGHGIQGHTASPTAKGGVAGFSSSAASFGVYGSGGAGRGGVFAGTTAQLQLAPATTVGKPKAGAHLVGDVFLDKKASIFICITAGNPGKWVEVTVKKV